MVKLKMKNIIKNKSNKFYKWLALPYLIIIILLIIMPILIICFDSIQEYDDTKIIKMVFTTKYYYNFYTNLNFIYIIIRSISISIIATFLVIIITYPLAYGVSKLNPLIQPIIILLINGTIWINMILKTQALVQILSLTEKFLNINILETNIAMFIGFLYLFLPYMFLSIYLNISKIDKSLIEAAQDLGANEQQVFKKIIFPLSLPGIIEGTILILLQIVTNIIVPKYLGPTNVMVISELIENKIFLNDETKSACVIAINLTILMLIILKLCPKNQYYKYAKEGK
ncbi:ABC transporter permease subunit [Candidatus Phytoplasma asiaticum]|uniref:ABC transporter permease subunit n=2 Tax=Candidatus Phytoplasma asiaticum TaxID=2763338 RepID=A0AAX3B8Y9_9MOLU|nr:ABC transporter permease subunit ['Parthenium hysterophorus' phyllody phytoplasma]UQV27143.1 ABC transporter permease subunit ['Parthenium hysterophorus' phyllody phytoplasma]